jgi:hypothetical protein
MWLKAREECELIHMDYDSLDRYLEQLDFLQERERLQLKIDQLETKLKSIQEDEPLRILKEIVDGIHNPEKLQKEWRRSGLVAEIKAVIDKQAEYEALFWKR